MDSKTSKPIPHTKGPWTVEQDVVRNGDIHIFAPELVPICDVDVKETPEDTGGIPREVALANARLIAASPDLLVALVNLANEASGFLALSDEKRHGITNSRVLRLRIEEARDEIVKAKWGQRTSPLQDGGRASLPSGWDTAR